MDINSHLYLAHVTSRFTSWLFLSVSSSRSLSSSGSPYIIKVFVLSSTVWQWNTEVNCKTSLSHAVGRWEVKGQHHKLFRCASFHMKPKTFLWFSHSFTRQRRAGSPKTTKLLKTCSRVNLLKPQPSFRLCEMAERRAWKYSDIMATLLMCIMFSVRGQEDNKWTVSFVLMTLMSLSGLFQTKTLVCCSPILIRKDLRLHVPILVCAFAMIISHDMHRCTVSVPVPFCSHGMQLFRQLPAWHADYNVTSCPRKHGDAKERPFSL